MILRNKRTGHSWKVININDNDIEVKRLNKNGRIQHIWIDKRMIPKKWETL